MFARRLALLAVALALSARLRTPPNTAAPSNASRTAILLRFMRWNLSAAQGNRNAASARDSSERDMTPAQIAEAQKLAREWQPKRL